MQRPKLSRTHFDIDIIHASSSTIRDIDRALIPTID